MGDAGLLFSTSETAQVGQVEREREREREKERKVVLRGKTVDRVAGKKSNRTGKSLL